MNISQITIDILLRYQKAYFIGTRAEIARLDYPRISPSFRHLSYEPTRLFITPLDDKEIEAVNGIFAYIEITKHGLSKPLILRYRESYPQAQAMKYLKLCERTYRYQMARGHEEFEKWAMNLSPFKEQYKINNMSLSRQTP